MTIVYMYGGISYDIPEDHKKEEGLSAEINDILCLIKKELDLANEIHNPYFSSVHEGYAVTLEELEELWDEIKKKKPNEYRLQEEALQVAAMAVKFIYSLKTMMTYTDSVNEKRIN